MGGGGEGEGEVVGMVMEGQEGGGRNRRDGQITQPADCGADTTLLFTSSLCTGPSTHTVTSMVGLLLQPWPVENRWVGGLMDGTGV